MRTFQKIGCSLLFSALLAGCATSPENSELEAYNPVCVTDKEVCEVPLINGGNRQWRVQAEVNGQSGIFILDTGADFTLITPQFAAQLGLEPMLPEGKTNAVKHVRIGTFRLGSMNYIGFYAPVANLDHINEAMHTEVSGILGNNLLNKTAYQIDWGKNLLTLMHATRPERPTNAIPVTIRNHRIFLNVEVNGRDTEFALDTGAYSTMLSGKETTRLHIPASKLTQVTAPKIDFTNAEPSALQTQVNLDSFKVGPIARTNYALLSWEHNALGMDLLEPLVLTVDPWQEWMSLKPSE